MPGPLPKEPLGSHCSVIFNDTLYTYSATTFQSLRLAEGAQWESLPPSIVSVAGAECVSGHRGTPQEALYIVGGSTNTTDANFRGIQRWTFAEKKWENLALPVPVTLNLINHGATYLESSQQIIVFSGTVYPDTITPSANTYLIGSTAPFQITSLPAANPVLAPLVLPWGDSGALVVGGDQYYTELKTFDITTGWSTLGMRLLKGIPPKGKVNVSLMKGDDGSVMLLIFDFSTTPASVLEMKVKDATSTSAPSSIGGGSKRRRQAPALTQGSWPAYDGSLAPSTSRDGFALAYSGDLVVISGGGDSSDPVAVFNARKNAWVNTTELFQTPSVTTESTSSASSSGSASSTIHSTSKPTSSPTTSGAGASGAGDSSTGTSSSGNHSSGLTTVQLLFVVLGAVIGAVLLLALILFCLKRRRRQGGERKSKAGRGMSFQDRGASFMQETDDGPLPAPRRGILGGSNSNSWVHIEKAALASSSTQSLNRAEAGPSTRMQAPSIPSSSRPPTARAPSSRGAQDKGKERGSGWSEWFSGANTTNLVTLPERTYSTARSSEYTDATSYPPLHGSAPLHTNPYLHNAGTGVIAGGNSSSTTNLQRSPSKGLVLQDPGVGVGLARGYRDSDQTSVTASSFSSDGQESITDRAALVDKETKDWQYTAKAQHTRTLVASSVYPESVVSRGSRRDTGGPDMKPGVSVDNLSWLNLRQS